MCFYAPLYDNLGNVLDNEKCPFCRTPDPDTDEKETEIIKKRVEAGDARATYNLGCDYRDGENGLPQDYTKALELWNKAVKLGDVRGYTRIGYEYYSGEGVEVDEERAIHYYELAAMGGDVYARHNLGMFEVKAGNFDRAIKHYTIATQNGCSPSLQEIQELYSNGHATKDDYMKALRSYQAYLGEIKSRQRDEAAAADNEYRYY